MFKTIRAAVLAVFIPAVAFAQACGSVDLIAELTADERARLDALVAPHPFPTGNMWRANKDGSTVIVTGTLHVPDARLDPMVETLAEHVRAADLLILEATSEDQAALAQLAAEKPGMFFITEGPTLIDLLGPEDWARAEDRLKALGIPGFLGAKFQPWYMNLSLALPPCAMALMQSGAKGLDRQLEDIAIDAGIPLASLDDAEDVLRLFADEPVEDQLKGLRITLDSTDDPNANTSTLILAFLNGRTREGWEFGRIMIDRAGIEDGQELFDEVNASLLDGRNAKWEPEIVMLAEGKSVVLAVGAAHLSGESGVLRALERAGYTVKELR